MNGGKNGVDAHFPTFFHQERDFPIRVGRETVDGNHNGKSENGFHIGDMARKVGKSCLKRRQVFRAQFRFGNAAVHLQCPDGCHHNGGVRRESRHAAFDVQKLFRAEVCAESRFGYGIIGGLQCHPRGKYRVAAVRNVCKRTAVYERGSSLERMYQIRLERVAEERGHSAGRLQISGGDGAFVIGIADDDAGKAGFQIRNRG